MTGLVRYERAGSFDGRPAVFLDRDGTVNELRDGEAPTDPDDVKLCHGAASALAKLRDSGYVLVCITNKPEHAKGEAPLAQTIATHFRVAELLAQEGARFDAWRLCLHHPRAEVAWLRGPCPCRKPEPGMILDVAERMNLDMSRSWMVGDVDSDMEAGSAAGLRTALVENPESEHKRPTGGLPRSLVARTLRAVSWSLT